MPRPRPEILAMIAKTLPARRIDRVRRFWTEIEAMRKARLTYRQIADMMPEIGGFKIEARELIADCYRIRPNPPREVEDEPAPATTLAARTRPTAETPRRSPLHASHEKYQQAEKVANVLSQHPRNEVKERNA